MSADDHAGAVLDVQAFAIPGDAVDNTGPDSRIELYDRCGFGQAKAVVGLRDLPALRFTSNRAHGCSASPLWSGLTVIAACGGSSDPWLLEA
jgi:hypothetical protein